MTVPVSIHDADGEADYNFITRAWRASFFSSGMEWFRADPTHYNQEMDRLFAAVIPRLKARIACDPNDRDNRLGFLVYEGDVAWFAYVLQDFRRMGIAPALLEGLGLKSYRLTTRQGVRRLKPQEHGLAYKPQLVIAA